MVLGASKLVATVNLVHGLDNEAMYVVAYSNAPNKFENCE